MNEVEKIFDETFQAGPFIPVDVRYFRRLLKFIK